MATAEITSLVRISRSSNDVPPLVAGDHLSREEFHRRYLTYPDYVKFELIGGVVYMASPLGLPHGNCHSELGTVLTLYKGATPGVDVADNATVFLSRNSEPQPDLILRILPEYGGQSGTADEIYASGAPELIVEVAHSSAAFDLYEKKEVYGRGGVLEYIVACVGEQELQWFDLPKNRRIRLGSDGVLRSRIFPGLWIDYRALFQLNTRRLAACLKKGLASDEHKRFVKRLAANKTVKRPRRENQTVKSKRRKN